MRLVFCNCPPEASQALARDLVTRKLAACVNVSHPVQSVYAWDGAVCEEEECTLVIKVSEEGLSDVVNTLAAEHPYDVPEILVIDVDVSQSHLPYVEWVRSECRSAQ